MIQAEWEALPTRFPNIQLHEFTVMPNHFHAIIEIITGNSEIPDVNNLHKFTIGEIIAAYKSLTTVKYIEGIKASDWKRFEGKLWQRNYYEHIIRTSAAFDNIANYIINNPAKWVEDRFYR
jgi:putative transposase